MSQNIKFIDSYQATTQVSAEEIWALWVDVNNWKKWDTGIKDSELLTEFAAGNSFSITPQGRDPIVVTLKTVTSGKEFSDETVLPFGVIRNIHRIEQLDQGITVIHEVQAEITPDESDFFGKEIWPHIQAGLPTSVNNIISLATEK